MCRFLLPILFALLTCQSAFVRPLSAADEAARLSLVEIAGKKFVQATGLTDMQWKTLERQSKNSPDDFAPIRLLVKPQPDSDSNPPAVFGTCQLDSRTKSVVFSPRYPLMDGIRYVAELRISSDDKPIATVELFREKVVSAAKTRVTAIYPTADRLPENLLKFYVHFSAPMSNGQAYQHIELVSDDGKQLMHPFLEIAEELWDPSGQRLTLLLDPARVKRGLVPHEEDGAILFAGTKYRLTIKRNWLDATGTPMVEDYQKSFVVTASDYIQPQVSDWKIVAPPARTLAPLVIDLQEPLDHAIVTRGIQVLDSRKHLIEGKVVLSKFERVWSFTPTQAWPSGEYFLKINDRIEDLVGNSIAKPFEVDRFDQVESPAPRHVELRFTVID
jgi:hypothetical protein